MTGFQFAVIRMKQDKLLNKYSPWGPPNPLSSGYWEFLPRGKSCQGVELTTYLN